MRSSWSRTHLQATTTTWRARIAERRSRRGRCRAAEYAASSAHTAGCSFRCSGARRSVPQYRDAHACLLPSAGGISSCTGARLRVTVFGATGVIGQALLPQLAVEHEVVAVSRGRREADGGIRWTEADVASGAGLTAALE